MQQDHATLNNRGLDIFAAGNPLLASKVLKQAYTTEPGELGILVNLGLSLMQAGQDIAAEHCYHLALKSKNLKTKRSAAKNLGFVHLWRGNYRTGWAFHGKRFDGEPFLKSQWKGEPLNGRPLVVWNDVGMGDAFQFSRYTRALVDRGEQVIFAVDACQIDIFKNHLAWGLHAVVDRNKLDLNACLHIPLMSLIPLVDEDTRWGRNWCGPTWNLGQAPKNLYPPRRVGLCWSSNRQDKSMHSYKSVDVEQILSQYKTELANVSLASLQVDEMDAHQMLGLRPASKNWLDTLTTIESCSAVISVDTAVAHLAAGADIPTHLLLGPICDWRWRRPEEGQWYPSLRSAQPVTAEVDNVQCS